MAMWCPNCKIKSPALAVGHDELICAKCNTEVVAKVPHPKSSRKRRSTVAASINFATDSTATHSDTQQSEPESSKQTDSDKTKQSSLPEVSFIERLPRQTPPKARTKQAQVKTTPQPAPKRTWRSDPAHNTGEENPSHHIDPKRIKKGDTEKPQRSTSDLRSADPSRSHNPSFNKAAVYFAIQLGLLIFLIGHGLTIWGFLTGNFGTWSAGSFCSVGGITIAVVSIVQALRQIDESK